MAGRLAVRVACLLCCIPAVPSGARPVVNEFVTRPRAGEGEWIEIRNTGPAPADLTGWSVRDGTGNARMLAAVPLLPGRGLLVLASRPDSLRAAFRLPDSVAVVRPDGWPVLNDRDAAGGGPADVIVLVDTGGLPADSVAYFEAWLPPEGGRSLERVDDSLPGYAAAAWGWSVDGAGATPGRRNSLLPPGDAGKPRLWDGPQFVSPSVRPAVFRYRMGEPGTLGITLVDADGRILAVLQPPLPVSGTGQWVWGPGAYVPAHPGDVYVCLLWRGAAARPVRRCLRVWVSP